MFRRSAQREPLKLKGFRHPHTTWFDRKAEASFAHSKRWREVWLLLQTLRLRHGPRCHDARSVWSARGLLPLCNETSKTSAFDGGGCDLDFGIWVSNQPPV